MNSLASTGTSDEYAAASPSRVVERLASSMPQDDDWFWGPTVGGGETTKPQPVAGKKVEEHPRRPGAPDCSYYVKFGSCKFGMSCVYNHPDPRQHGADAGGDDKPEQFPRRPGEPDCSYYVKFGSCKFGMNCRFNHPPCMPVPPQEGTGLCSYYMNRGICKFGTNCKFDHPDPGSDQEKWVDSSNAIQVSSQVNIYSVLDHGESNGQSVTSEDVHQPGNPSFQLAERISYTRDQLLELCQIVDVPKDILELRQDINVELEGEGEIWWVRAETNHVQTPYYCDWHSRSAQTHPEDKFWDNISEAKEPYALGWKKEQFNKHDQSSFHFDSKAQDGLISALAKAEVPLSIQRGSISGKDEVLKTLKRILNTLTPKMFNLKKGQLIEARITSADILKDVINLIFEKVVAEPAFCLTYAQLCSYLNENLAPFPPEDCDGQEITFKQALSNKCQEIFETARTVHTEIDKLIGPDQEMERRDKERVAKLETLGNIHFIRDLLKKKLVTDKIIHQIVQAVMDCGAESNICVNAMISGNKSSMAANDVQMIHKNVSRRNEEAILRKSYNEVTNNSRDPHENNADAAFSHLVENEKPTNLETSVRINRAGCSISEIMELVVDAGAVEGSDEHFIATLLFIKPEYREIFLTLDTCQGRLGWLKRMYKVKE